MQKVFALFILLFSCMVFVPSVSAHLLGQPPFFKINGVYSDYYPIPSTSLDTFMLPQDIGSEPYLVNQTLHFELDQKALPVPAEIIAKTKFKWDFGDGSYSNGFINDHSYTKPGSYVLMIHADTSSFERGTEPQLLQSVMLHIVPNKNYQLPKSVIVANGKSVTDPIGDWLTVKPGETLTFDASKSFSSSSIAAYVWDFGDGTSGSGKTVTHAYKDIALVFPLLRIKTSDGFIADSFLEIHNGDEISKERQAKNGGTNGITDTPTQESGILQKRNIVIGFVVIIVFISTFLISRWLLVRKRKRR